MKTIGLFLVALFITSNVSAQSKFLSQKSCFSGGFENFDTWVSGLEKNKKRFNKQLFLTRFNQDKFNAKKAQLDCVDFTYEVDGLTVEGYYLKPKTAADGTLPVVIFNRGGNGDFGRVKFASKIGFLADLAQAGYVVIGSQYRGASTRFIDNNGADEFGGKDVNDVLALPGLLADLPAADANRIALVGWSRGVMQSYLAAKQMPTIKAIVAVAGNADEELALAWRPAMEKVFQKRVPDFAQHRDDALKARSVIHWIDQLPPAPVLLIHGSADKRVSVKQSEMLAEAFVKHEHAHKLIVYPGDNHGLHQNRSAMLAETLDWLARYL
ncbi:alpha/beta hydrolase family protein [Alteromonas flava]|uniref:alpha/beta hydrolase family protein n=1 Tax=Alteromonas flava TaxID=2048003 RepID=UPI0013DADDDD|nr:prolyl oligopeptidase family serine peptidase [Alteromonas flava]